MADDFSSYLGRGEIVRWHGRPQQGVVLRSIDLIAIPVSLLWCGFAIFWEYTVVSQGSSSFMMLWGVPFVCVGLYFVFGRFLFDAFVRSKTRYALTDHRALILGGLSGNQLTEVDLRTISEIRYQNDGGSKGTISFGSSPPLSAQRFWASTSRLYPEFFRAENAAAAYKLVQAAKAPRNSS